MKRIFTPCVLLLMIGSSCQKSAVSPASAQKPVSVLTLQAGASGAQSFNTQQDVDLVPSGLVEVSACNGDVLEITSGQLHLAAHQTINKNDLSVDQHTNAQNLKMVSTTTGARYTGSSTTNVSEHFSFTDGKLSIVETESALFTTPGSKNNSIIKFDLHETFDDQGNMTVHADNFRADCR